MRGSTSTAKNPPLLLVNPRGGGGRRPTVHRQGCRWLPKSAGKPGRTSARELAMADDLGWAVCRRCLPDERS